MSKNTRTSGTGGPSPAITSTNGKSNPNPPTKPTNGLTR